MTLALFLPPTGRAQEVDIPADPQITLQALQSLVGGDVAFVEITSRIDMVINADGKVLDLPLNHPAGRAARGALDAQDWVVGPVVIVGRRDGDVTDCPWRLGDLP